MMSDAPTPSPFNWEAAFADLKGQLAVILEKFTTQNVQMDNIRQLFTSELQPIKTRIEELEKDAVHCAAARKTADQAVTHQFAEMEKKIAVDPSKLNVLEGRLTTLEKRDVESVTLKRVLVWTGSTILTLSAGALFTLLGGHAMIHPH